MKFELELNTLDHKEWWFNLGICFQKTTHHPSHKWVIVLGLGVFSIYIRF
jgi:hypothetical protein